MDESESGRPRTDERPRHGAVCVILLTRMMKRARPNLSALPRDGSQDRRASLPPSPRRPLEVRTRNARGTIALGVPDPERTGISCPFEMEEPRGMENGEIGNLSFSWKMVDSGIDRSTDSDHWNVESLRRFHSGWESIGSIDDQHHLDSAESNVRRVSFRCCSPNMIHMILQFPSAPSQCASLPFH